MLDFRRDNNIIYATRYYNCMRFRSNNVDYTFSELKNDLKNASYDGPLSSIYDGSLVIRNGGYEFSPYFNMSHYQNRNLTAIPYRSHWNKTMTMHSAQLRDWDDTPPDEVIDRMNDMVECIVSGR